MRYKILTLGMIYSLFTGACTEISRVTDSAMVDMKNAFSATVIIASDASSSRYCLDAKLLPDKGLRAEIKGQDEGVHKFAVLAYHVNGGYKPYFEIFKINDSSDKIRLAATFPANAKCYSSVIGSDCIRKETHSDEDVLKELCRKYSTLQ